MKLHHEAMLCGTLAVVAVAGVLVALHRLAKPIDEHTTWMRSEVGKKDAYQKAYKEGFADAVKAYSDGNMIRGPITFTGQDNELKGKTIVVVNVLRQPPMIVVTNGTNLRWVDCEFRAADFQTILSDETRVAK